MKEISLHILDIAQNSIAAGASLVDILIEESHSEDLLCITIRDNGKGMKEELLSKVTDPFITTRKSRRVGLGLSLFKASAEACNGEFHIDSKLGEGTVVNAKYQYSHIDRPPMGDLAQTLVTLVACNPSLDFVCRYFVDNVSFTFSTYTIKEKLVDIPINHPNVIAWIQEYLNEGINSLNGGA